MKGNINLLFENNILKMKADEAAEYAGYTDIRKFQKDFYNKFGMHFQQKQIELRTEFLQKHYLTMSDDEISYTLGISKKSVAVMRSNLGLLYHGSKRKKHYGLSSANDFDLLDKNIKRHRKKITLRKTGFCTSEDTIDIKLKKLKKNLYEFKVLSEGKYIAEGEYYNPNEQFLFGIKEEIKKAVLA